MAKTIDNISKNRRDHLDKNINSRYKNINDFCTNSGEDYGAIHRYLNNVLPIGNIVVRRLEKFFDVPAGSFDKSIDEKEVIKIPVFSITSFQHDIAKLKSEKPVSFFYMEKDELISFGWKQDHIFGVLAESQEMAPIIKSGTKVLIDTSSTSIIDGTIYAILVNDKLFIRKIIHSLNKKTITLIPENKDGFEKEELGLKTCKIIGRVVSSCGIL